MVERNTAIETPRRRLLVLASGSPRRRDLIQALDARVESLRPTDEEGPQGPGEAPHEFVMRLALDKAAQVSHQADDAIILGADTVVVLDGDVLGKPASRCDATLMLHRLRGRVHAVVTGVAALDTRSGARLCASFTTQVTMRHYDESEIAAYVLSGEPLDKAGAYAVQDEDFRPVHEIDGCYLNVVGLPLCEVFGLLDCLGASVGLKAGWQVPSECRDCRLELRRVVTRP